MTGVGEVSGFIPAVRALVKVNKNSLRFALNIFVSDSPSGFIVVFLRDLRPQFTLQFLTVIKDINVFTLKNTIIYFMEK